MWRPRREHKIQVLLGVKKITLDPSEPLILGEKGGGTGFKGCAW